MDYTPYYETMRRTSLLRGMTDAELDTLMACFAPRVRRYAKGELLLMAGYETHEVGLVLEGAITASKPLADGSTVIMARMGPGGVFADVLAGGRSRSPVNVSAAEACLALYLPCEALLRPCAALHSAHLKLLQNWLETISDKYFALDRRLELICCKSLRGRICMWLLEQRERCGADTFSTAMTRTELAAFLNCDRSALSRELSRMQEEGLIDKIKSSHCPAILAINKIDTVEKDALLEVIAVYSQAAAFDAIIPISAKTGDGVEDLLETCGKYAEESPFLFPEDVTTDQPERQVMAEIIREKLLWCLDREVPHGTAVEITKFSERDSGIIDIDATIYCEKASHKGIIIGKNGAMLKKISSMARADCEKFMGTKVFLTTWVKVKENWRDSDFLVRNFGYSE